MQSVSPDARTKGSVLIGGQLEVWVFPLAPGLLRLPPNADRDTLLWNNPVKEEGMDEEVEAASNDRLTGGDWVMAVVAFFLTPLVALILSIYNFAKSRRSQGFLYLGVIGVQVALIVILASG